MPACRHEAPAGADRAPFRLRQHAQFGALRPLAFCNATSQQRGLVAGKQADAPSKYLNYNTK